MTEQLRRRRGTGSFRWNADHTLCQFRLPVRGARRVESPFQFTNEEDADRAMLAMRDELVSGKVKPQGALTLGRYFDEEYLPHASRRLSEGSIIAYKSHFGTVRRGLGDVELRALTSKRIRRWTKTLTMNRPDAALNVLRLVLSEAVTDEHIETNPCSGVKVIVKKGDPNDRYPTPEEQAALLSCPQMYVPDWYAIAFAIGAGLRPGEWRLLHLVDVYLDAAQPYVTVRYGTFRNGQLGPTKGKRVRDVPLFGIGLRALQQWLPRIPEFHPVNPFGLVFPTTTGCRRSDNAPFNTTGAGNKKRSIWRAYLERAGIARPLTPHCLRHGFATSALTGLLHAPNGRSLEAWQVSVMLGHSKLTTTLQYLHHTSSDLFRSLRSENQGRPPESPVQIAFAARLESSSSS